MSINFTKDQASSFEAFCNGNNIFLSGDSGTGKTALVKEMIKKAQAEDKKVAITASTGIAASLLPGGRTIHSLLQSYPGMDFNRIDIPEKASKLKNYDVLIIDEISMLGKQFIPYLYNCYSSAERPLQLIVVGDFFQLPPVKDDYAFKSPYWDKFNFVPCLLHQVVRQKDEEMIKNINRLKYGDANCLNYFISHSSVERFENQITICARAKDAGRINQQSLEQIKGASYLYSAKHDGKDYAYDLPVEKDLLLKVGARVMSIINTDTYINGSLGTVINLNEDSVDVLLDSGETTRFVRHAFDSGRVDAYGNKTSVWQFPLRLAHAITIHKAQGQTFKYVNIDGSSCWAPGQLYVAISRAESVERIHFTSPIRQNNIVTDLSVMQFYKSLENRLNEINQKMAVGY